jgi:hypothetical protein
MFGQSVHPWVKMLLTVIIKNSNLLSKILKNKIYRTINLSIVLYGCETRSLILRKERRLRVLENRVLRSIFGPKRDKLSGVWSKLHNKELHDLYSSPTFFSGDEIEKN